MNLIKILPNINIILTITVVTANSLASIIDHDIAPNITPPQEAWLIGDLNSAKNLYISSIDTAVHTKHIIYYNLAYIYYLEKNFDKATEYLNKSLNANKKYGPALFLCGLINFENKNYSKATEYLKKSVDSHPFPQYPEFYLGLIHLQKGNLNKAEFHFLKATKYDKKFTKTYPYLAKVYLELKDTTEAEEALLTGLGHSYDAEIVLLLGDLYNQRGDVKSAKKYYGIFAYLFPQHPEYSRVVNWLSAHNVNNPYTDIFHAPPRRTIKDRFFPIGEEKIYNVFFGPIKSGELYTKIAEALTFNGVDVYKVYFSIDSNPALEFIASVHSDYITYLDQNSKLAVRHFLHTRENKIINEKIYDFDRKNGIFKCRVVHEDGHIQYIEKWLPKYTTDGTSILFYARQLVKERRSERVMTIIDENFVISDINFDGRLEPVEHNGQVEMGLLITGKNHYKGILGFTGNFRGWFRNDNTHLPIQADFEIWVGRILIVMGTPEELKLRKFAR